MALLRQLAWVLFSLLPAVSCSRGGTLAVQAAASSNNGSPAQTLVLNWDSAPRNGNTLILFVSYNSTVNNLVTGVSQEGCHWTRVAGVTNHDSMEVWAASGTRSAGKTATIAIRTPHKVFNAVGAGFDGVAAANVVDKFATNTGTTNPCKSGMTEATEGANEVWIAGYFTQENPVRYSDATNGYQIVAHSQPDVEDAICMCERRGTQQGSAGGEVQASAEGANYAGISLTLRTQGVGLSSTKTEDGVKLSWQGSGFESPDSVSVLASDSPTMDAAKTVAQNQPLAGSFDEKLELWRPTYFRVLVKRGSSVLASSNVALGLRTAPSTWKNIETYSIWWEPWESGPGGTLSHLGKSSLVIPGGLAEKAHSEVSATLGVPSCPYVTFFQTQMWAPYENLDTPSEKLIKDLGPVAYNSDPRGSVKGFVLSPYTRGPKEVLYTACPNSVSFRNQVFSWLRTGGGASATGLFVDNGWTDPGTSSQVCVSPYHPHFVAGETNGMAFMHLLVDVVCEMKRRNPNSVILLNGGPNPVPNYSEYYGLDLMDLVDCYTAEDFLCSSESGASHRANWQDTYARAVDYERSNRSKHAQWAAFSYPRDRDEAYLCYCTAKLCNLSYTGNNGASGANGHWGSWPEITNLRLGAPIGDDIAGTKLGDLFYRAFQNGFVLVNPEGSPTTVNLPSSLRRPRLNVYDGKREAANQTALSMPPQAGRVFLWEQH